MIYRIHQLKLPLDHKSDDIKKAALAFLGLKENDIEKTEVFKRSVDARNREDVFYIYAVDVYCKRKPLKKFKPNEAGPAEVFRYKLPERGGKALNDPPVIIGFGPAGLFAAYILSLAGFKPIVLERGKKAEERQKDIDDFLSGKPLNPDSNVLFGEGGAGTFSDGKLNTLIKDRDGKGRFVLKTFVDFGADEDVLYDSKPHIGTDKLSVIVKNMREKLISLGADIRFNSRFNDFKTDNDRLCDISYSASDGSKESVNTELAILATGHSARDVFKLLNDKKMHMSSKAFAIGVRAIHPQELISKNQYGDFYRKLPAASYKLTAGLENGRSVYSFCMCPGGYVVNSSSEEGMLVVNGMSYSARDGAYANAAIIVNVTPEDFEKEGFGKTPLSGVEFQKKYERKAYEIGRGKIPVQNLKAFSEKRECNETEAENSVKNAGLMIKGGVTPADLNSCLPEFVCESLVEGFKIFDRKIKGFGDGSTILAGIESRTSSPVRINRDENMFSSVKGLIPCGEGAGYAGGIMSAALDGIKAAERIIKEYYPAY